ncbi:MAG: hypothetical protein IPL35_09330 [Sphingobacteriales bacterium]|nr:hypothetical protein [Sphingobacteriales bacterium]
MPSGIAVPHREANISLDYFNQNMALPQIFDANHKYHILRADKSAMSLECLILLKAAAMKDIKIWMPSSQRERV